MGQIIRFRQLSRTYGAAGVSWWNWQQASTTGWHSISIGGRQPRPADRHHERAGPRSCTRPATWSCGHRSTWSRPATRPRSTAPTGRGPRPRSRASRRAHGPHGRRASSDPPRGPALLRYTPAGHLDPHRRGRPRRPTSAAQTAATRYAWPCPGRPACLPGATRSPAPAAAADARRSDAGRSRARRRRAPARVVRRVFCWMCARCDSTVRTLRIQSRGDLAVGVAECDQPEHLELARATDRRAVRRSLRGSAASRAPSSGFRYVRPSAASRTAWTSSVSAPSLST